MGSHAKKSIKTRYPSFSVYLFFILALTLIFTSPYILECILNTPSVKDRLSHAIETHYGLELHQDKIKFLLFPKPGLCVEQIDLRMTPQTAFSIEQVVLYLDIGNLLKRKLTPKQIHIHRPTLHTFLAPRPGTHDTLTKKTHRYILPRPATARPANDTLTFSPALAIQYAVQQVAGFFPESRDDIRLNITQGSAKFCSEFNAQCIIPGHRQAFNLNIEMNDINLARQELPQFAQATDGLLNHVAASHLRLNLHVSSSGRMDGNMTLTRPEASLLGMPQNIIIPHTLPITVSISPTSATARIGPWHFKTPEGEIFVEMDYNHSSGDTRLIFRGKGVNIAQARSSCLALLGGHPIVDTLFNILRAGKARDIMVGFESNRPTALFNAKHLIIQGSAVNARVTIPGVPLLLQQVNASVSMKDGVLHILPEWGIIHGAQIKGGILDIDIMKSPNIPFAGKFNIEADLSSLPHTLSSLLPGTSLSTELARISEIKGKTHGVLKLDMPAKPHATLGVCVDASIHEASGRYAPVPWPITLTSGKLHYTNDTLSLDHLSGQLGNSPLEIEHWEVALTPLLPMWGKGITGRIDTEQLFLWAQTHPEIMKALSPVVELKGPAAIEAMQISGPMFSPKQWKFNLRCAAQNLSIGFTAGQSCIQNITGMMTITQNSFTANGIGAVIEDLSWLKNVRRHAALISSIRLPLTLSQGSLTKAQTGNTFKGRFETPKGPVVTLELAGSSLSSLKPSRITIEDQSQTFGHIIVNHGAASHQFDLDGQFNTLSLEKMVRPESVIQTQMNEVTGGTPLVLSILPAKGKTDITVNAEYVDLDALLLLRDNAQLSVSHTKMINDATHLFPSAMGPPRPLIAQQKLVLTSQVLTVKKKDFKNVVASVNFDANDTKLFVQRAELCDLKLDGDIVLSKTPNGKMVANTIRIRSQKENTKASRLFSCLLGEQSLIKGECTIQGELSGKGYMSEIRHNQNGIFSFDASNGRIYQATILSRILSLLNILGETDVYQNGFGYKSITAAAEIKNSVIHIQKAYIDAVDMAIIASGWVDPLNDRLEMTFLVAPFKTIDTVIQYIPLVNTIFKDRLASFPLQVSGKLSDPKVIPLHPSAVSKGLITLFDDLIKAPVRMFTGDKPHE